MDNSDCDDSPGTYDPESGVYRIQYDKQSAEPVSTVIVKTVAVLSNTPPTELDPLYENVNPDALNGIFDLVPRSSSEEFTDYLTFTYGGCGVTVFSSGLIEINPNPE